MNKVIRILVGGLALCGVLAVLPGVAEAREANRPAAGHVSAGTSAVARSVASTAGAVSTAAGTRVAVAGSTAGQAAPPAENAPTANASFTCLYPPFGTLHAARHVSLTEVERTP
jgi:hypothetical protein